MDPRRKATEAEANALASGIRLRIIRLTYAEALTNKELAERLGRDPATTLHHVRKLVDAGFLRPQPARRGNRGAKEIPYRSTGLSWRLDNADSDGVREAMLEAFLAEVAETGPGELDQSRLVVQMPAEEQEEFRHRLRELLDEFAARPRRSGADRMAVYLALYPSR
ncbi:Helix-turn-helix domain-containing protein [Amycolatopsis arida]|uniref:Helix-turn-helix domain-containing protein n=1 Tax=Amycolatopsis arida TaxID=587909 RepID=A0A1I5XNE4_9PSEU|nr:winged helix-turn-helix domain-containing protein [Amycolatopsis arida]TDX97344.1 helix-turn-helix protein [Amycolatopsis arida]SFQ33503.1 Helix-turn-helix domain-containing protein [Amycolatopsis arida]